MCVQFLVRRVAGDVRAASPRPRRTPAPQGTTEESPAETPEQTGRITMPTAIHHEIEIQNIQSRSPRGHPAPHHRSGTRRDPETAARDHRRARPVRAPEHGDPIAVQYLLRQFSHRIEISPDWQADPTHLIPKMPPVRMSEPNGEAGSVAPRRSLVPRSGAPPDSHTTTETPSHTNRVPSVTFPPVATISRPARSAPGRGLSAPARGSKVSDQIRR